MAAAPGSGAAVCSGELASGYRRFDSRSPARVVADWPHSGVLVGIEACGRQPSAAQGRDFPAGRRPGEAVSVFPGAVGGHSAVSPAGFAPAGYVHGLRLRLEPAPARLTREVLPAPIDWLSRPRIACSP